MIIEKSLSPYEAITFDDLEEIFEHMPPTTPFAFYGRIGAGKTAVFNSHPKLQPVEQIGLAMHQVEDIGGCIFPDRETGITQIFPMKWFAQFSLTRSLLENSCDECKQRPWYEFENSPVKMQTWEKDAPAGVWAGKLVCNCGSICNLPTGTIFFDEADKGEREVQIAMMRILSERTLGDYIISPLVRILVVSNRKIDQCAVWNEMPNETKNRVVHLELVPTFSYWERKYATPFGAHPLVIAYLRDNQQELCKIDPGVSVYGFQSSRSWSRVSDTLKAVDQGLSETLGFKLCVGAIGRGGAEAFWGYRAFVEKCTPIAQLADGSGPFPSQEDLGLWIVLVARCVAAAEADLASVKKDTRTLQQVVQVLIRMPEWARQYQMLLATWLRKRPLTKDLFLNQSAMQTDKHLKILGEALLAS